MPPQLLRKYLGVTQPIWSVLRVSDGRSASRRGGKRCAICERVVYYPRYGKRCIPCSGKEIPA